MRKQKESALSNTKIAIVFFVFLVLVVGISLIFKTINIISQGKFDSSKRFTLSISNGKNTEVMSLNPGTKEIVVFRLNDGVKPTETGQLLKIPVDGFIVLDSLDLNQKANALFMKTVFKYNCLKTDLTIIDLFKLAMSARSIPESSVTAITVGDANGLELDKVIGHLVSDSLIEKDQQTIRIVNATDVIGLGNRLARLITNMGGDVILVETEDSLRKKSTVVYADKKTYTVEKLQKVLGYEAIKETGNAISDITIIIGKDKINSNPF